MKRDPWISLTLSGLKPGLGQMYNGQLKKGIIIAVSVTSCNVLFVILAALYWNSRLFSMAALAAFVLFPLAAAIEAFVQSRALRDGFEAKKYNRWYYYAAFGLAAWLCFDVPITVFIKNHVVNAYTVPTDAMENTILAGDFLLASRCAYTSRHRPRTNDIVVFDYFGIGKKAYIKRVAGTSGQTVRIAGDGVFIDDVRQPLPRHAKNGNPGANHRFPDTFAIKIPSPGDTIAVEKLSYRDFLFLYHTAKQENRAVEAELLIYNDGRLLASLSFATIDNWLMLRRNVTLFQEGTAGPGKPLTYRNILKIGGKTVEKYVVKNDNFFVFGDNRGNSLDSRHFGCVNGNSVKGKAALIYMSIDVNAVVSKSGGWFRWDRIGKRVK